MAKKRFSGFAYPSTKSNVFDKLSKVFWLLAGWHLRVMCFQKCHCFASASLSGVKVKLNLEKSPHKSDYIQDIWIHPKQHQKRKKKILQKPESLDLQSCPVALKTNESPPVRKCQHFAGDLRQHTNFWDFSTLALISTESCHFWPGMLHKRGICQIFYTSQISNVSISPEKRCKLRNVYWLPNNWEWRMF